MKIELSSDMTHGTDRGGEDLFLLIKVTQDTEPDPKILKKEVPVVLAKALEAYNDTDDLYTQDGCLCGGPTDFYQIEFAVDKKTLTKLVMDTVLKGEWVLVLRTKEYRVENRIFMNGNAE